MCAFSYNCATYVSFMHQFTQSHTHTQMCARANKCICTHIHWEKETVADRQTDRHFYSKCITLVGNARTREGFYSIGKCHLYENPAHEEEQILIEKLLLAENWQPNSRHVKSICYRNTFSKKCVCV